MLGIVYSTLFQKNRKKVIFSNISDLLKQEQLYIVYELIRILTPIDFDTIFLIVQEFFGKYNKKDINRMINILISCQLIERNPADSQYLSAKGGISFIDYEKGADLDVHAEILEVYRKIVDTAFKARMGAAA